MGCILCDQSREPGWLCADHPWQPWEHGDCKAEGAPCPRCNPHGLVELDEVFAALPEHRLQ